MRIHETVPEAFNGVKHIGKGGKYYTLEIQPLVSIVIPVYNAEKTLAAVIESIQKQTWTNLQIILVNDGSTDGSLKLARSLTESDSRMTVITQENRGVSAARNAGIELCRGKYIRFVDADDTLPPESTEQLVLKAEQDDSDLVIGGYTEYIGLIAHSHNLENRDDTLMCDEVLQLLCRKSTTYFYGVLWNKIFRSKLIAEMNLRFESGLTYGEDFAFIVMYLRQAKKVSFLKTSLYDYRRNSGSMTIRQVADCVIHPWRNIDTKRRLYRRLKELYIARNQYQTYRNRLWLYLFRVGLNQ